MSLESASADVLRMLDREQHFPRLAGVIAGKRQTSKKLKKPSVILITVLSIIFSVILFKYGMDKVITQLENGKRTFVLNWPEWIFWSFVPIGAACMVLHIIEYFVDYCAKSKKDKEEQEK